MNLGRDQLAFALDVHGLDDAKRMMDLVSSEVGVFKVGLELFTAVGPAAVSAVHERDGACFLDLKVHDIGATVARAARAAADLGVRFLTLHAAAGRGALEQAARAVEGSSTRLLAVTVLTNLNDSDLAEIGLAGPAQTAVSRFARLAYDAGVTGLVCSAHEAATLRAGLGSDAFLVTPGIRLPDADAGDQQRVQGPAEAIRAGSNLLVVGRPIRDAQDPAAEARRYRLSIASTRLS